MSESGLVSVAIPGPWWTQLTYAAPRACETGVRVRVPLGGGSRIGLVCAVDVVVSDDYGGQIRALSEVIDERPLLPDAMLKLLWWFADTYLCGVGTAMKTLLPAAFLHGDAFDFGRKAFEAADDALGGETRPLSGASAGRVDFIYEPVDADRFARYARILSDGAPSLASFPLHASAKSFFEYLMESPVVPKEVKECAVLYPHSGPKTEWRAWSRLACGKEPRIVIGAQSSAMAPVRGLARVIVEDESNIVWRTMRHPVYNVRSLLSKRARLENAVLILGGRLPSSRAYLQLVETKRMPPKVTRKIINVDLRAAYSPQIRGVADSLAVSEPLVRETEWALDRGAWAIWILDRKGYAGEIVCEECGASMRCPKCGGGMRWEPRSRSGPRLRCVSCGETGLVPDVCPYCRGRLLSARRPGLDALLPLAKAAIQHPVPIISLGAEEADIPGDVFSSRAGLLIGTRAALALCDKLTVGLIGWIDPDGEARSREYDARVRAFGLIWESCWRGLAPQQRRILMQSRRPGKDWQRGLAEGWQAFWRGEINERRQFSLPPFVPLIGVDAQPSDAKELCASFDRADIDYWETDEPEDNKRRIWARTSRMAALRAALEPLFGIGRAKRGYPGIAVWYE